MFGAVRLHKISRSNNEARHNLHTSLKASEVARRRTPVSNAQTKDGDDSPKPEKPRRRGQRKQKQQDGISLEDFNPISMGRKSREVFDDVWTQLQRIGSPSRTFIPEEEIIYSLDAPAEFESPQAPNTTVLVVGATGRVGRVLVRKLLIRGYKVRALVRERSAASEVIPRSVELITGDVGDYTSCREAVEGSDKVIFCATARSTISGDLNRVNTEGLATVARAVMDYRNSEARKASQTKKVSSSAKVAIADFKREVYHAPWDLTHLGPPDFGERPAPKGARGFKTAPLNARDKAECYINEDDRLVFEGAVYSRGGYAEMGADVTLPQGGSLDGSEGLVLRMLGDGQAYSIDLETEDGIRYTTKVVTPTGFLTARLPFETFAPLRKSDDGPLNPATIKAIKFKFEPKTKSLEQVLEAGQSMFDQSEAGFKLELAFIKALPAGQETDIVLVSCAGTPRPGLDEQTRDRVVSSKRKGETYLRNSGLGYTIVRPGPLLEEAGGYKALVFDQKNRIQQGIACADVADVCLKALHDPVARNKTFEVCWEYTPEAGLESYELVAHLPDRSNNYLTPALSTLQKNT